MGGPQRMDARLESIESALKRLVSATSSPGMNDATTVPASGAQLADKSLHSLESKLEALAQHMDESVRFTETRLAAMEEKADIMMEKVDHILSRTARSDTDDSSDDETANQENGAPTYNMAKGEGKQAYTMPYCLACHEELGKPIELPQPAEIVSLLGDVLAQIGIYDAKVDALAAQSRAQGEKIDGSSHAHIEATGAKLEELQVSLSGNFESIKTSLATQPIARILDKLTALEGFEDDLITKMTDLLAASYENAATVNRRLMEQTQLLFKEKGADIQARKDMLKSHASHGRIDITTPAHKKSSPHGTDATGSTDIGATPSATPSDPSVDRALFTDLR